MIYIAHLYPNEMDLYGENGNIKALTYLLDKKKIKYKIDLIDINDELNFNKYDFIYIGSGRTKYLDLVKERLKPFKKEILSYINSNKIFLTTGNAVHIFDFLDFYHTKYFKNRCVSNVVATTSLCNSYIIGFQNTEYLIESTNSPIFQLTEGFSNQETKEEGYSYKNFYATSIIGPLLARNDELCKYFVHKLVNMKKK